MAAFSIKFFGVSEWAVRLPSALFGVLTVLITYFLVKELLGKKYALLSSFLLAVSPWHIQLSRAAFEANVATFFTAACVWLFLKAINGKPRFLLLSVVSAVFSIYTFNTPRVFVPLLFVCLTFLYKQKLWQIKRQVAYSIILGFILMLPLLPHLMSNQAKLRYQEVNIFSDSSIVKEANARQEEDSNNLLSKLLHNRRWYYVGAFAKHYLDEFSGRFLFIRGDQNSKFSLQTCGELWIIELPFLLGGFYFLIKNKERHWKLLLLWMFIASIPAATARETPHALRSEVILPTFQIIIAYGFVNFLQNQKFKNLLIIFTALFLLIEGFYFYHDYRYHYLSTYSQDWNEGTKQIVNDIKNNENKYDRIIVSTKYGRPYIFFLFYRQYPLERYLSTRKYRQNFVGVYEIDGFDKYEFRDIDYNEDRKLKKTLLVGLPEDFSSEQKAIFSSYFYDGRIAFKAVETQ